MLVEAASGITTFSPSWDFSATMVCSSAGISCDNCDTLFSAHVRSSFAFASRFSASARALAKLDFFGMTKWTLNEKDIRVKQNYLDTRDNPRYIRYVSEQPISIRRFPSELYKRIKMEAVRRDTSVKKIIIEAVKQYLKDGK